MCTPSISYNLNDYTCFIGKLQGYRIDPVFVTYEVANFQTQDYYKTHLSIAYDMYDPTSIVFSIGDYNGQPMQFGVKGNLPDPKDVGVATGLVKYELVQQDWADPKTGQKWDRDSLVKGVIAKNSDRVQGVALVKMLEDRKIQVEIFPSKTANQASGFSANSKIYER